MITRMGGVRRMAGGSLPLRLDTPGDTQIFRAGSLYATLGTDFTLAGDIVAAGGFRRTLHWARDGLPASATTSFTPGGVTTTPIAVPMIRGGSCVGISINLSGAAAGSNLSIGIYKNGSILGGGFGIAVGATSGTFTIAKDSRTFVANDTIGIRATTDGSWTGTLLRCSVVLEFEE